MVSGDGRFVEFDSDATNLTPDCASGHHVYVRDRTDGSVICASAGFDGNPGNGVSEHPAISADGTLVAFTSTVWKTRVMSSRSYAWGTTLRNPAARLSRLASPSSMTPASKSPTSGGLPR